MKKNSNKYLLLFIVICAILFSFALIEVLLRGGSIAKDLYRGRRIAVLSNNPELGYELRPDYKHGLFHTNSSGFRGKDFKIKKKKDIYRIVVIGDSIPFGVRMDEKNIFPVLLQKKIKNSSFNRNNIEVINAGIGGYNIWQYGELYKTKISKLSPDLIIVSICQNDFEKSGPYFTDMWGMVRGGELEQRTDGSFLDNFYLYRKLSLTFQTIIKAKGNEPLQDQWIPKLSAKWEIGEKPLLNLINQIKQNKTSLLFVIFPYQYQVADNEEKSDKKFSSFMQKNDIQFIDMLPFYRNFSEDLYDKNDQIHPNITGHRIASDAISNYLSDM